MKISTAGAELLQTDRRKNMTKLIVTFRNFAKAPKNLLDYSAKVHVLVKGNICLRWDRTTVL